MNEKRTWFEIGWKPLDSGEEQGKATSPRGCESHQGASPESSGSQPHDHDGASVEDLSTETDGREPLDTSGPAASLGGGHERQDATLSVSGGSGGARISLLREAREERERRRACNRVLDRYGRSLAQQNRDFIARWLGDQ